MGYLRFFFIAITVIAPPIITVAAIITGINGNLLLSVNGTGVSDGVMEGTFAGASVTAFAVICGVPAAVAVPVAVAVTVSSGGTVGALVGVAVLVGSDVPVGEAVTVLVGLAVGVGVTVVSLFSNMLLLKSASTFEMVDEALIMLEPLETPFTVTLTRLPELKKSMASRTAFIRFSLIFFEPSLV